MTDQPIISASATHATEDGVTHADVVIDPQTGDYVSTEELGPEVTQLLEMFKEAVSAPADDD